MWIHRRFLSAMSGVALAAVALEAGTVSAFAGAVPCPVSPQCCDLICAVDPFCCETGWDVICCEQAALLCDEQCDSGGFSCAEPYIACGGILVDQECCELVCNIDPFCCPITWDTICCGVLLANCFPESPRPDPQGPGSACGNCCQAVPSITGFSKPIMASTDYDYNLFGSGGDPNKIVLRVYDIGSPPGAPGLWVPPTYSHPSWTLGNLGTVFGVTLDGAGNIYLSHGSFFYSNEVGFGGTGAVTAIDGSTGAASLLVDLPNSQAGPGLGNITWSCGHESLYVTNFEDGRLYRIDPTAVAGNRVKSAWDFATDTVTFGALAGVWEFGDPAGIVPYGQRIFAVADGGDRLFFSVWNQDSGHPGSLNTIWSVATNAAGDPIPGTKKLEILLNVNFPTPVADLAFDGTCCLYAAQRSLNGLSNTVHESELLRFCWDAPAGGPGSWTQSGSYVVGQGPAWNHSSAGGVGVDNGTNGLVWATGDALKILGGVPPIIYGVQGLPQTGGDTTNSILIDNDNETIGYDKTLQGSCEVVCTLGPPCEVVVDDVHCVLGPDGYPNGEYSVTVTITNNSGHTANLILIPTLGTFEYLDPPLQNGQSKSLKLIVTGNPGEVVNIPIGLYNGTTECCGVEAEFELPDCKCALFSEVQVECIADGDPNTYTYNVSFKVCNISQSPAFTATWLFFIPPQGSPYSFSPTVKNVFPLTSPGCVNVGPVTLTFTTPPGANWTLDIPVSIHNANLAICCDTILHLEAPPPCPPACAPDLNGDGLVNGADLAIVLGAWGSIDGGCADLNGDGIVNGFDIAILLGAWS